MTPPPDRPASPSSFTARVKALVRGIPRGKVATYGLVAAAAGNPRGARQVARILHACSRKDRLPWHRVVNRKGGISLGPSRGYEVQRALLEKEGVVFAENGRIDLDRDLWRPGHRGGKTAGPAGGETDLS